MRNKASLRPEVVPKSQTGVQGVADDIWRSTEVGNRSRSSAEFTAKVPKEAMKGEATLPELASRFEVHPTMVAQGNKQALDGPAGAFAGSAEKRNKSVETEIKELHTQIGQLTVEEGFLPKASGRAAVSWGRSMFEPDSPGLGIGGQRRLLGIGRPLFSAGAAGGIPRGVSRERGNECGPGGRPPRPPSGAAAVDRGD